MLRENELVNAMIDTSDGLSTDLAHICEESHVGAIVAADLIPRARVGKPVGEVDLKLALHGGEDYELLFTVSPGKRVRRQMAGVRLTEIGRITRERKLRLSDCGVMSELEPRGWEHFRR
jgi:thiamine-monophosphate kinase